jgi:iron complex transport system permease protein
MVTAACGPIAFLGLAVPHLARSWFRSANHKVLIPSTLALGIFLALLCDLLSRLPWSEHSLPLNAITSFIGAPIVLSIILRTNKLKSYY